MYSPPTKEERIRIKQLITKDDNDDIVINYSEILGIEDNYAETFSYVYKCGIKKRKIKSRIDEILKSLKFILKFADSNLFIALMRLRIIMGDIDSYKIVAIKESVKKLVESTCPIVDFIIEKKINKEAYKPKKQIKEIENNVSSRELYFGEDHLKYFLKLIALSKVVLLFSDNIDTKNMRKRDIVMKFLANTIWNTHFREEDTNIDIKSKIQKFFHSRISSTIYSDRRFWNQAEFFGITPVSFGNELYINFLKENVLMLDINMNPISFLDVFSRQTVTFLFKKDFKYTFIASNIERTTESLEREFIGGVSEADGQVKFFANAVIQKSIKDFIEDNSSFISEKEYNLYNKNFERNITHLFIVFPFLSKVLKIPPMNLLNIDRESFIKLSIYTKKVLIQNNFYILSKLIGSNIVYHKDREIKTLLPTEEKKLNSKKGKNLKYTKNMKKHKEFVELIKEKYSNFETIIQDSNIITDPLSLLFYNDFIEFGKEEVLDMKIEEFTSEYTRFLKELI